MAGSILQNDLGVVDLRSMETAANATGSAARSPHRQPYKNEQSIGQSIDLPSPADALHPDHLLPADVLQRARSIINEHLAEHKMPLVDSLSEFNLGDAPHPEAIHKGVGILENVNDAGPASSRMAKSNAAMDDACQCVIYSARNCLPEAATDRMKLNLYKLPHVHQHVHAPDMPCHHTVVVAHVLLPPFRYNLEPFMHPVQHNSFPGASHCFAYRLNVISPAYVYSRSVIPAMNSDMSTETTYEYPPLQRAPCT